MLTLQERLTRIKQQINVGDSVGWGEFINLAVVTNPENFVYWESLFRKELGLQDTLERQVSIQSYIHETVGGI